MYQRDGIIPKGRCSMETGISLNLNMRCNMGFGMEDIRLQHSRRRILKKSVRVIQGYSGGSSR